MTVYTHNKYGIYTYMLMHIYLYMRMYVCDKQMRLHMMKN